MTEQVKVSDWLADLGTHSIMDNAAAKADFTEQTGEEACWHEGYTQPQMQRMIEQRGKGGHCYAEEGVRLISTLDIAEALADRYVPQPWYHNKIGMGFAVRACIDAIREAGH